MELVTPTNTYLALLIIQAAHLLHHRLKKRHISFVEVMTAAILCIQPSSVGEPRILIPIHLSLMIVQLVGSLFIGKLSPDWARETRERGRA